MKHNRQKRNNIEGVVGDGINNCQIALTRHNDIINVAKSQRVTNTERKGKNPLNKRTVKENVKNGEIRTETTI